MDRSPIRDFIVGLFVIAGLVAIVYLSVRVGGFEWSTRGRLRLSADFDETGRLAERAPVVIAGVRVGEVSAITLDANFRAHVVMDLDSNLQLSADTQASIVTGGILGDRYVELQPGGDTKILKSGDQITMTQSAVILEHLIGDLVTHLTGGNSSAGKPAPTTGDKP